MRDTFPTILMAGVLCLAGPLGCARSPEQEQKRAVEQIEFFITRGSGGAVTFDETDPKRPPIAVTCEGTQILDAALRPVGKLTTLRELNIGSVATISDVGVAHLSGLVNLQVLNLYGTRTTDAGLEHLKALVQLHTVDLGGTKITDAGLKQLAALPNLQTLNLRTTAVTDAGLGHLKALVQLHTLNLEGTKITDAGLKHLAALPHLQTLNLRAQELQLPKMLAPTITDAGLKHLHKMRQLRTLILTDTQVTDAGVEELQKALPELQIER